MNIVSPTTFAGTTRSVVGCNSAVIDINLGLDDVFLRRRFILDRVEVPEVLMESCKHALIVLIGGNKNVAVTATRTAGSILFGEIFLCEKIKGDPLVPSVFLSEALGYGLPISPIIRGIISGDMTLQDIRHTLNG